MPLRSPPTLFPATPAADGTNGLFAQVAFNHPLSQLFTYAVPAQFADDVAPGKRVQAPFGRGNRPAIGYCVELLREPPSYEVKELTRVLDETPLLTESLLRLTRWMADYYMCGWGQVLNAVIPAGAKTQAGTREQVLVAAVPDDELTAQPVLTTKQDAVLAVLRREGRPMDPKLLAQLAGCGAVLINSLVKKGYARRTSRRTEASRPTPPAIEPQQPLMPNADQVVALAALQQAVNEGGFHSFLLHGVTGSGKTEIYLQAIQQVVQQGMEAMVLVPEISLTPQTIERFHGRFPRVAVLHSHLTNAERGAHWRRIAAGEVQVIVGARSAVFAPTRRLGLIVVDEEHETSFKQETTPRYHGRDVAVMRARLENIPIVLGSATPSLESWFNADRGQYQLLSLPKRVLDLPLPQVGLIDLRHEPPQRGKFRALSRALTKAMRDALDAGGQVILLLNRRGYATCLFCPQCGHVVKCRFCDVSLIDHRAEHLAKCHYCGYEQKPPDKCPACGKTGISFIGQGTEKLEAEIAFRFPGIAAQRMDSDTMRKPGSHAKALDAFRSGDVRILLGTQMIAKGLDFPNVTLVGVVDADIALHLPDFRSGERTFQLLAQVAGRTGRGMQGGRVLVQTFNPDNPSIEFAAGHDFQGFVVKEMEQRRQHNYPPYHRMVRVVMRAKEQAAVAAFAESLAK
jgi:primosomal protein N' (replication factor Y)